MLLHEDVDSKGQNMLEYQSNGGTWCMKHSALNVGLIEDKINYEYNAQYVQY